jgi:hypothetical protein
MAADNENKDGPQVGGHRQPAPQPAVAPANEVAAAGAPKVEAPAAAAPQAWVPGKKPDAVAAAEPAKVEAPAAAENKLPNKPAEVFVGDQKKEMTAKEKLEAGISGIIAGEGGLKEGQLIGEAVGEKIKGFFGQEKKEEPAKKVKPEDGPIIGSQRQKEDSGGLDVGGSIGKKVGGMIGSAIGGEKTKTVGQVLGKVAGNLAGQVANLAVDHARGIGGGIGSAIGSAIGGEKGAEIGKNLGKNIGSGVKNVRDELAEKGIKLGEKPAGGKHSHGVK